MSPVAVEISSWQLRLWWHDLTLAAVLAAAVLVLPVWLERWEGIAARKARFAVVVLLLAVLAGGRVHFFFNHPDGFVASPIAAILWKGGLHAGGAVLGLVVAAPLVLRWADVPAGRFLDGIVVFAGLGIALARLGCFLHGCCFGTICNLPWAVRYPVDSLAFNFHGQQQLIAPRATLSAAVHPLPLYFAACGLVVALFGAWYRHRRRFEGEVAALALIFFGVSSAALELLRADLPGRPYWAGMPQLFWFAIVLAVCGSAGLYRRRHARAVSASGARLGP